MPEAYTHFAATDQSERSDHIHLLTVLGFAGICHAGWALGVGRRLLDELRSQVQAKAGRPGTLADGDAFDAGYAQAEGKLRSARAYAYETWSDVEATIRAQEPVSDHQRTLIWHTLQHLTWSVHAVGEWVYTTGGTTARRAGTIQSLFRDLHAGTQHVTSGPGIVQGTGRKLAGLADDKVWAGSSLVPAG